MLLACINFFKMYFYSRVIAVFESIFFLNMHASKYESDLSLCQCCTGNESWIGSPSLWRSATFKSVLDPQEKMVMGVLTYEVSNFMSKVIQLWLNE